MLDLLALYDTETTGVDPATDEVLEVAVVLWSVKHRAIIECKSVLISDGSGANAAESVNGIPVDVLPLGRPAALAWRIIAETFGRCDAICAHFADFDRSFTPPAIASSKPWLDSNDIEWPKKSGSRSLAAVALAHGVGVVDVHRALADCLTLARLLERVGEMADLEALLVRAMLPRVKVVSLAPFDRNPEIKAAGFCWDPVAREWFRRMLPDEAAALGFAHRIVGAT